MTVNGGTRAHATQLKALLVARHLRGYAAFAAQYERAAAEVDSGLARTAPSREQYERWLAGRVKTLPYAHHCRVLEAMFPGHTAEELLAAPPGPGTGTGAQAGPRPGLGRREVLHGITGATALGVLGDHAESVRRAVEHHLPSAGGDRDADDWERTAQAYAVEVGSAPPQAMLTHLLVDLAEVREGLAPSSARQSQRRLLRVATELSVLVAVTQIAVGAPQAGRRWWRTARRAAATLDDPDLESFVVAQNALLGMYCGYGHAQVLDLAAMASSVAGGRASVGAASASTARAQALAALGREREALAALDEVRALVERLPGEATGATPSYFGYADYRLRHAESYVFTRLGKVRRATHAQEAAFAAYPPDKYRGLSQVHLHRAACMVLGGDVDEGVEHACATLRALPPRHRRDGLVREVAATALNAVPPARRQRAAVRELHALVTGDET